MAYSQPTTVNDLMILADCMEKMRALVNDKDINNLLQDKQHLKLAENMAKLNRYANTCSGIFFSMHMDAMKVNTKPDDNHGLTIPPVQEKT